MTKSTATLKEIAAAAGCSPRAVAAVLNPSSGNVRVGEGTKQRVQQIAQELGYRRNEFARAMVIGQSRVIGLLTSVGNSETVVRIMEGALDEAAAQGYVTKILRLPYFATPQQVHDVVQLCSTWRLDGVLAIGPREDVLDCLAQEIEHNPRPIAYIESSPQAGEVILIRSDDAGGIHAALAHLAELGHRRVAFLGGRPDSSISRERAKIFSSTMRRLKLPVDRKLIIHGDWSHAEIIETAASQLLDAMPRPTAIFCAGGDAPAMVTLRLARRRGLCVPEQLSVVGYGNSALSAYADPALTTVAQPFGDMGHLAVQRLLERIASGKTTPLVASSYDTLPQKLIVRASTARLQA